MIGSFRTVISASLSPNTTGDDVITALGILGKPWEWKRGKHVRHVESWFRKRFDTATAVSFNSGRSALLAILKAFTIGRGDEVLIQAFTCVAVPNSVLWAGATPVYVDIDETLNMDPIDAAKKVSSKTKALIVQHTFGVPANMEALVRFVRRHNLILIEDCAHALGARYRGKLVGTFGDAAFFSFGRDKVISSVFGGMAIIQSKLESHTSRLKEYHNDLPYPSVFWIMQQLLHPIAFSIILPLYTLGIGKVMLVFLQRIKLLSLPVYTEETQGKKPDEFPKKYPNALAALLVNQLRKLESYNQIRKTVAKIYRGGKPAEEDGAIYLRFPVCVSDPKRVVAQAKKKGILFGNWYHCVIDPERTDKRAVGYVEGSCPNAEKKAAHIINLPTKIMRRQAEQVLSLI